MSALTITAGGPLKMSSREIADLTGKEHGHVLRDIRVMVVSLYGQKPGDTFETVVRSPNLDHRAKTITYEADARGYIAVFYLDQDHCLTLVTGYDVKLRHKIMARWRELEETARRPTLPDFANPVAAARAWADEVEAKQIAVAALEEAKPKLDAYDHFLGSRAECLNLQRAMKMLGIGPNRGIAALRDSGVLFGSPATPKQYHCDQGYFEVKPIEGTDGKVRPQTLVTPKGLDWLRARLAQMVGH